MDTKILKYARIGDVGALQRLLTRHKIDIGNLNSICNKRSGDTVHIIAARQGHLATLKYLYEQSGADNAALFECANLDGKRPLHEAIQGEHFECVEYLVSVGVLIDSLKKGDWTPLMLACTRNNLDIVKKLIEAGASLTLVNKDGWNPLHIAIREGHPAIINCLLDYDAETWNTKSKNGRTPLHTAALHGLLATVDILLTRGRYHTDEIDSCHSTPLMDALRAGHTQVADLLINKHKANVNAVDILGRQCIHLAAETGSTHSLRYIINEHQVDVNTVGSLSAATPLHHAVKEGHHEMMELLVSLGADVHKQDNKGRTALDIASRSDYATCAKILLAEVNNTRCK